MRRRTGLGITALAVIMLVAGQSAAASARKDLTVAFYEKRIQDMTGSGLVLNFVFRVSNSAAAAWYLTRYDHRLVVDNSRFLAVDRELAEPIAVPASSSTLIALPVKITYAQLLQTVPSAAGKDRLSCYLVGGMTFSEEPAPGGSRLAVACSGEFPVYRDIEVRFKPLEVKDLTIGGGDLVFKVGVRNANSFALQVEDFRYVLDLAGVVVSSGPLIPPTTFEAGTEKEFAVPLLLDFFELGNALHASLQKPEARCRFSGRLEFQSEWGRFVMPIEKSESIPVTPAR